MEPIEEQLRALLVDIVRNCQSTVAQNFELMNRPSEGTRALAQHPSQETYVAHTAGSESRERAGSSGAGTRSPGPNFFVEPPHLDEEVVASLPATSHRAENKGENLAQASDSGYGTLFSPCQCPCHLTNGLSSTLYGNFHIHSATRTHSDFYHRWGRLPKL